MIGTIVARIQVDDQDDQQQCQSERDDDIVDAEQDRPGRVDDRVIVHSLGERLRELPHRGVDLLTYLDGIAARRLVDHDHAGGLLLVGRVDVVSLRAQLDVGHVFQIHERPVRLGAKNDPLELLDRVVLGRHAYRIGELGRAVVRLGAELAAGYHLALLFDGRSDVGDGHSQIVHSVGLDPNAHRIGASAHDLDASHTVDPRQPVLDMQDRVIAQEVFVVSAVRVERQYLNETAHRFLGRDSLLDDDLREHGRGRRYAVLREDRIHVGIRSDGERHLQRHAAVVRVGRLHVDHVAHAVDAFFERRGDALFDRQRVGSEILGRYLDHGRGDVRILLDRHAPYGDQSEHDDHNGYDHREDRTSDEDISHLFQCFTVESAVGSGSTTAPSRSLWNPEVTIRSPAFTPEVTIRRSPYVPPSVTIRCRARLSLSST